MEQKNRRTFPYLVEHPELGQARVEATDRLRAICAAAKTWGVPWTSIARACAVERLESQKGGPRDRRGARCKSAGD